MSNGDESPLSDKQLAFVEAYLANGFNGTKAAIEAGYSEKTARSQAARLLANVNISSHIRARMKQMTMDADEALTRLSAHARGDLGEFIDLDGTSLASHPQSFLLKRHKRTIRVTKDGERIETVEVELHDPQSALVNILREQHLRAGEPTERNETVVLTDDQRAARIRDILERAKQRAERGHSDPASTSDA